MSFQLTFPKLVKFGLSEKHSKFEKILLVVWTNQLIYLVNVKTMRKIFFKLFVLLKKSELYTYNWSFFWRSKYIASVLCYITLFDMTTNVANFEITFAICIIDIRFIHGVQWPKIWMQLVFAFQKVNKMPLHTRVFTNKITLVCSFVLLTIFKFVSMVS